MPGSPYRPALSTRRRIAYFAVALLIGPASTFGNALVNTNVTSLAGEMGVFVAQASLLPAMYVAMNATANLTLVKARSQFGIPLVLNGLLIAYLLAGLLQLFAPVYASALVIRGVDGLTAAVLVTTTALYLMQALPGTLKPMALLYGISLPQLGTLARPRAVTCWRRPGGGLHLLELGVGLTLLAVLNLAPLPPTEDQGVRRLDLGDDRPLNCPPPSGLRRALAEAACCGGQTPLARLGAGALRRALAAGFLIEHRGRGRCSTSADARSRRRALRPGGRPRAPRPGRADLRRGGPLAGS